MATALTHSIIFSIIYSIQLTRRSIATIYRNKHDILGLCVVMLNDCFWFGSNSLLTF